jgi:UDP-glucose:(heptosyl)LPS alpha-1,3-glucosyltransferase
MRVGLAAHQVRPTGGQDRYLLELARRLAGTCDLHVIAAVIEGELPAGVRVHRLKAPTRPMLLAAPLFRSAATPFLTCETFDVMHAVGGALPGANVITAAFCHAAWRAAGGARGAYQRLVSRQAERDERRAYGHRNLRAVIAVSRRVGEEVERHYGPLRVPVTVIPNGVDLDDFAPAAAAARRPPGARARLLLVGAWERKGLATAIAALAGMRADAELRAVGAGDRDRFRRLASRLGVADRVRLEPPRARIADAMREADLFVLPTRYDPFGMVIAEAMACGLPVVTSAVAGAADLIRDGESGRVVADPADAAAFARAMDDVLADEARGAAMGRAARAAVADLGWDRIAQRTLEVYRRVTEAAEA